MLLNKDIVEKYGDSQLLFTFYCITIVNNMIYSKTHFMPSYRKFICQLGMSNYNIKPELDLKNEIICSYHTKNITCYDDIYYGTKINIKKLLYLYTKLDIILCLIKRRINIKNSLVSISKSTIFLTLFNLIHRILLCYKNKISGTNSIIDSQFTISAGSLMFQLESKERQIIINKYMTALYIDYIISLFGLNNKHFWNTTFIVSIMGHIHMKGIVKTLQNIIL